MRFLVTGGAGFIGSALIRFLINETQHEVLNIDSLTYAGCLASLGPAANSDRYKFVQANIADESLMLQVMMEFRPHKVLHLAAESHVDRSVDNPGQFIQTNICGTYSLLQASLNYYRVSDVPEFMFHHVSTDEVFGSLGPAGYFSEISPYAPSSPYSASKSASDHLVRAWHSTYNLPTLITNCSNNYGPFQFPEKLIPLTILNALEGKPIGIYGNGQQVRDWLHVEDHVRALYLAAMRGEAGQTYLIGGNNERTNLEIVQSICSSLTELNGDCGYSSLIKFVADRPGHDTRYAVDATKIKDELGWEPLRTVDAGIEITVKWYMENRAWCQIVGQSDPERKRKGEPVVTKKGVA